MKLLYAEDNPQDADLTRAHFGRAAPDLRLEIAETGGDCLERLAAESFDLLLLDNHLPDMDGLDVLEQIRAAGQRVPVVMITGAGDDETVARALRAGASDYIPKSGDYLTSLPEILRRVVEEHRRHQQFDTDGPQRQRRILHVEPNPMDVDLTVSHFASAAPHLKLHSVANCQDALALLTSGSEFDLVLTDLRVPGMNALEFLHEAKHLGCDLPFIVITGRGDEATAVAILRLGAYDYLVKRENYLTQLPHAIDHALQRFQLDQQTRRLHAQLATLNASLEDKVATRTAELQREVNERRRLEIRNLEQLEKLSRSEAEVRQLLRIAEDSRRALLGVMEDQQRTEQALRDSERHLRNVLDTLPAMIAVLSPEGLLLDANRLPVEMFGLPKEETIGRPFAELPPWTSLAVQQAELRAAIQRAAAGDTVHYYVELPLPSGQLVVIATWIVPLKDEAGRVTQLIASGVDITDRKRAEDALREAKRKLDSTVNNLSGFVYRCANQPDWPTEYLSDGVFELFGYPAEDFTSGKRSPVSILEPADRDRVWQEAQAAIAARRPYVLEYRVRTATGEQKWAWERGAGVFDGDTLLALEGFVTDITDRKRAEAGLIESQQRLALATDSAHIGIWDWDVVTNKLVWDANMYELYGIRPQDFGGAYEAWEMGVHPDDRERAAAEALDVLAGSGDYHTEFRVVWPNGEVRHLEAYGVVQRAENGAALRMLGTNWDNTERKRAEEALREREQQLSLFVEHSPAAIAMLDRDLRYLVASHRWLADYRVSAESIIGRSHYDLFPEIPERWKEIHRRCLAGAIEGCEEDPFLRADGTIDWVRWEIRPWHTAQGDVGGLIIFSELINARKQAEIALRESDERHRTLFDFSPDALFLVDATGRFLDANRTAITRYGYSRDELLQLSVRELAAPDLRDQTAARVQTALQQGSRFEWRHCRKDGSEFPVEIATQTLILTGQTVVLSCVRDISDQKQAEARLRESERRFSTLYRVLPVGTCISRFSDGVFLDLNESFAKITGHTREELLGHSSLAINYWINPEDRAKIVQSLADNGFVRDWEVGFRRKDGSIGHSLRSLERLTLDGEDCILTALSDITERKHNEEELRISRERLEVLSRQLIATQESERRHLARELHDEIGQELTSVKLNLRNLQQVSSEGTDLVSDTLLIAEHALQQVRSLALDLRPSMLDDIGLAPALRWCLDRQAHRAGFAPHFVAEPPELAPSPEVAITCFRVAQESLTNIARHAQARNVRMEVRQYETAIDLQVQDDGIGFDVNAATEQATHGASLGLLGMRERAELVGGLIDIESTPNSGTTIHARFPLKSAGTR